MGRQSWRLPLMIGVFIISILLGLSPGRAAAQITVTSATPNNAPQGTTNLNVTIAGSGFAKGATATWYVSGTTSTGGVIVNSTTFVNSKQIVANITIPENARVSGYNIVVTNASGRTGVGSDLFTVNPEAVTSNVYSTDTVGHPVTIQGDSSTGTSVYRNDPPDCSTFDPQGTCIIMSLLPNDWYLHLYSGSGRTVYLTFSAVSGPNEGALDGYYLAGVAARCFNSSNTWLSIPLTIPPGTSNNRCSLRVNFTANGINYLYVMSPIYAGTGWSTVACTSGTSTETCNAWSITPTPPAALPNHSLANVANLYTVAKSGKMTLLGTYTMTFNITLTQP